MQKFTSAMHSLNFHPSLRHLVRIRFSTPTSKFLSKSFLISHFFQASFKLVYESWAGFVSHDKLVFPVHLALPWIEKNIEWGVRQGWQNIRGLPQGSPLSSITWWLMVSIDYLYLYHNVMIDGLHRLPTYIIIRRHSSKQNYNTTVVWTALNYQIDTLLWDYDEYRSYYSTQ